MIIHKADTLTIHKNGRFPLNTALLDDNRIGLAAKGLLIWLLAHNDGNDFDFCSIRERTSSTMVSLMCAVDELIAAGYISIDTNGQTIYTVHEEPMEG